MLKKIILDLLERNVKAYLKKHKPLLVLIAGSVGKTSTKQAIATCVDHGFSVADAALVSFHGRSHSALLTLDCLGSYTLRSFTGEYDRFGTPVLRDGDLQAESVYRFKGQTAAAVVLTEIDFAELDALCWRKLFVGMTRARLKLVLVLSERAATVLLEKMA